jgi:type II secretory pathway pseudopilin PulG
MRRPGLQRGFSYLLLLFAVAALGIASAGSAVMWSTLTQSERERELLFIGGEFARALQRYHDASPVEPKRYPATCRNWSKTSASRRRSAICARSTSIR